jgi:pimeloyl-ACP methyl ester carboxylesterase
LFAFQQAFGHIMTDQSVILYAEAVMPNIDLNGQGLFYRDEGRGDPLFLLSANPGDSRDYDAVAPSLARRFRVIRPDWPGCGGSPAPQPVEQAGAGYFLEVFARLMDALGIGRAHLVGNSVGGNVAIRHALAHPDRVASLVLVSTGGFSTLNAASRIFCRLMGRPAINRALRSPFTRSYLHVRNEWTQAMLARALGEQAQPQANAVNAAVWRSFLNESHDLRSAARALRTPTLVINGRHDPVLPANRDGRLAAATIPGARLLIPECGHAPFAEVPSWFLDTVNGFWDALERQRAAA